MDNDLFYINKAANTLEKNLTTSIFESSRAMDFHKDLKAYKPTPLVELKGLAEECGVGKIFIKDESFRFGLNAFKGLGASYAIHKVLEKDPYIETFCTATDGNHGRAVAWAARLLKKNSRIFVPANTTRARIEAIESEGAILEKFNGNYEETCNHAQIMADGNGWALIQDAAREDYEEIPAHIMAGYFTQFQEMENEVHTLPGAKADIVFLQSGVGSWPAAAAWYYLNRYGKDRPKLVIVEPTEAAGFLASLKAGKRCSPSGSYRTMMAGLNCGIPSTTAWEILKNTADAALAIEDSFTATAIKKLYNPPGDDPRIISGESGAAGVAGFLALISDPRYEELKKALDINQNSSILFYSTEGATDPDNFNNIVDPI